MTEQTVQAICDALGHVTFGSESTFENLRVVPLLDARSPRASSASSVFPAIGEGSDVRLTGTDVSGAALVADGRVIHLSAFPIDGRV